MAEPHVRLVNVSKRFGSSAPAVDGISLSVPRGSFTTFLGPSGCGKTTTLRMIAGFYEPDAGDIFLGERRVNEVPAHRRGTAMVFQDYALFPHMSVRENVAYGLKLARVPRPELERRLGDTLKFLGLIGLEDRSPNQLSGGQQQRVALARALVMNPEVLLLDEPLSNLDAKLRVSIRGELLSIQRQLGITTIYVTHDQDEALAMSDWVAVMNHGHVIQWGTPWEIYYRPRTTFMADFVGSVNLLRVPIVAVDNGSARVRIGEHELTLPLDPSAPLPNQRAIIVVRPESLRLVDADTPVETGIALPGQVEGRTFLGHLMRYSVRVGTQAWIVDQPDPGARPTLRGAVTVVLDPARLHVIAESDAENGAVPIVAPP